MNPTPTTANEFLALLADVTDVRREWCVVGTTPYMPSSLRLLVRRRFCHSQEQIRERLSTLTHDGVVADYRTLLSWFAVKTSPTLMGVSGASFKRAMQECVIDDVTAVATNGQIRLSVFVDVDILAVYGIPELLVIPNIPTGKVSTLAIVPKWACRFTVRSAAPIMREQTVATLLAAAGAYIGIGEGRSNSGHGRFRLASPNDPEFLHIVKTGGRAAQVEALAHPIAHDRDTENILASFDDAAGVAYGLRDSGHRRHTASGRHAVVWEAVQP